MCGENNRIFLLVVNWWQWLFNGYSSMTRYSVWSSVLTLWPDTDNDIGWCNDIQWYIIEALSGYYSEVLPLTVTIWYHYIVFIYEVTFLLTLIQRNWYWFVWWLASIQYWLLIFDILLYWYWKFHWQRVFSVFDAACIVVTDAFVCILFCPIDDSVAIPLSDDYHCPDDLHWSYWWLCEGWWLYLIYSTVSFILSDDDRWLWWWLIRWLCWSDWWRSMRYSSPVCDWWLVFCWPLTAAIILPSWLSLPTRPDACDGKLTGERGWCQWCIWKSIVMTFLRLLRASDLFRGVTYRGGWPANLVKWLRLGDWVIIEIVMRPWKRPGSEKIIWLAASGAGPRLA